MQFNLLFCNSPGPVLLSIIHRILQCRELFTVALSWLERILLQLHSGWGGDFYMSLPLLFSVGEKKLGNDLIIEQQCVLKNQSAALSRRKGFKKKKMTGQKLF